MGADLVAFVSFGPSKLDESLKSEAAQKALERRTELKEAAEDLLVNPESGDPEFTFPNPGSAKRAADRLLNEPYDSVEELLEDPASIDAVEEIFGAGGIHRDLAHAEDSDIRKLASDFVDFWNGNLLYRNATWRQDPEDRDRKVVVAGERTWGDEPQGAYELMRKAINLDITDFFGISA